MISYSGFLPAIWKNTQKKFFSLPKHSYSNILKILQPKTEKLQMKNSHIVHILAQNIDCEYSLEAPSNEYLQSLFSRNERNITYAPVNPSSTI